MKKMSLSACAPVCALRRRGFTMTEIAIVLGIVGIIFGAIWAAASMVYENNRAKEAREQTLSIVNSWRSIFGSRQLDLGDGADITAMTVNDGFAPSTMLPPAGTSGGCAASNNSSTCFLIGPWSGSQAIIYSFASENAIRVQYYNLTQRACNRIGNALANDAGLVQTVIDGTSTAYTPLGTARALTASDISAQCNQAGSANYVAADFSMN